MYLRGEVLPISQKAQTLPFFARELANNEHYLEQTPSAIRKQNTLLLKQPNVKHDAFILDSLIHSRNY